MYTCEDCLPFDDTEREALLKRSTARVMSSCSTCHRHEMCHVIKDELQPSSRFNVTSTFLRSLPDGPEADLVTKMDAHDDKVVREPDGDGDELSKFVASINSSLAVLL